MGEGVCHTAAVADDVQAGVIGLEIFIQADFHVVEFYFHAVEQGVVVGCARRDLVQGIDHLDDTVQDSLGQDQAEVAGSRLQCRLNSALRNAGRVAPASAGKVAEALHDDTAAQHVGQAGDALPVTVAVLKRLGEMLGDQQGEIGVFCFFRGILKAVSVDSDDPVGVLVDHDPVGIHAECADTVFKLLCAVYDLTLVQFVSEVGKNHCRKLDAHTDIHAVGFSGNLQIPAHLLHPLAAAAAGRDDAIACVCRSAFKMDAVTGSVTAGSMAAGSVR